MKQYKQTLLSLLLSIVTLSFAFADGNAYEQSYDGAGDITSECNIGNDVSLFVLESIFSNPKNPYPLELWDNRDNEKINIYDIAREIKSIAKLKESVFKDVEKSELPLLFERLSQMEDIADRTLLMEADKWKASYVNELMKHIIGIRHAGISARLPDFVEPSNCYKIDPEIMNPCNEEGEDWSKVLFQASLDKKAPSIFNYMKDHETDIKIIKDWWNEQQNSSWRSECQVVKFFYSKQRTLNPHTYYWSGHEGYKTSELFYSKLSEHFQKESYKKAFTIWHAYVQEVLSKINFPHNNQNNKEVCLTRSIGLDALHSNGISDFGMDYTMPSAVYDSYSLANIVWPGSFYGIIQSLVPHHRILHLYPLLDFKYPDQSEFIVLSGPDLPFDYFYNADENLSVLKERLNNGKDSCPGFRLNWFNKWFY